MKRKCQISQYYKDDDASILTKENVYWPGTADSKYSSSNWMTVGFQFGKNKLLSVNMGF